MATQAVIISGTRKGEIVVLPSGQSELTPQTESVLDQLIADAELLAENARAAANEAAALHRELRQRGTK